MDKVTVLQVILPHSIPKGQIKATQSERYSFTHIGPDGLQGDSTPAESRAADRFSHSSLITSYLEEQTLIDDETF
jgi:hypothetical protein